MQSVLIHLLMMKANRLNDAVRWEERQALRALAPVRAELFVFGEPVGKANLLES